MVGRGASHAPDPAVAPDPEAAGRLRSRVAAVADDAVRAGPSLLERGERMAAVHGIAVSDASYVAAADASARLVSGDVRDLVSRGLAILPAETLPSPVVDADGGGELPPMATFG